MGITTEILEMLSEAPVKNGRYVISEGMNPNLKRICEATNKFKDEHEKKMAERRRVKHSMGL